MATPNITFSYIKKIIKSNDVVLFNNFLSHNFISYHLKGNISNDYAFCMLINIMKIYDEQTNKDFIDTLFNYKIYFNNIIKYVINKKNLKYLLNKLIANDYIFSNNDIFLLGKYNYSDYLYTYYNKLMNPITIRSQTMYLQEKNLPSNYISEVLKIITNKYNLDNIKVDDKYLQDINIIDIIFKYTTKKDVINSYIKSIISFNNIILIDYLFNKLNNDYSKNVFLENILWKCDYSIIIKYISHINILEDTIITILVQRNNYNIITQLISIYEISNTRENYIVLINRIINKFDFNNIKSDKNILIFLCEKINGNIKLNMPDYVYYINYPKHILKVFIEILLKYIDIPIEKLIKCCYSSEIDDILYKIYNKKYFKNKYSKVMKQINTHNINVRLHPNNYGSKIISYHFNYLNSSNNIYNNIDKKIIDYLDIKNEDDINKLNEYYNCYC